jgi:O-antigen ligase
MLSLEVNMTVAMLALAVTSVLTLAVLILMLPLRIPAGRSLIYLIAFSLPFLGAQYLIGDSKPIFPINLCLADVFVFPAAIYLLLQKFRLKAPMDLPLLWLFWLFFLWMLVSLYAGIYKYSLEVYRPSNMVQAVKFFILIIYFYVIVNLVRDADDLKGFVMAWGLSGGISAFLGIVGSLLYQIFGISTTLSRSFRAMGTFGNPNMYSGHILISFFLAFVYFKLGGKKWVFISLLIVYLVGLIMSASKGGMIAFLIAFIVFAILLPQYRIKSLAILTTFLLVCSGLFLITDTGTIYIERLMQVTDTQTFSARSRLFLWDASFEVWKDNPFLGVGRGKIGEVSSVKENEWQLHDRRTRRRLLQEEREENDYIVSHSTYISLLCETGIIGLFLFISIMATFLHRVIRSLVSLESSSGYYFIVACLGAALTGILVQGIVTNVENLRSLWCLAGLICVISDWILYDKTVFKELAW